MPDEIGVPAEGAATTPEAAPAATPDYAPVLDRVNELASGLENLTGSFQQFVQAQQPPPEEEPDPWAVAFGLDDRQPAEVVQPPAPQMDPALFQQAVDRQLQQALTPFQQQLQTFQQERALEQIYRDLPHLADKPDATPEQRQQVMQARQEVAGLAQAAVAQYPPHVQQALLNDPNFITMTVKAAEADRLARAQVPAGENVPSLEAAGGAHPGGSGEQQSIVELAHSGWQPPKGLFG